MESICTTGYLQMGMQIRKVCLNMVWIPVRMDPGRSGEEIDHFLIAEVKPPSVLFSVEIGEKTSRNWRHVTQINGFTKEKFEVKLWFLLS